MDSNEFLTENNDQFVSSETMGNLLSTSTSNENQSSTDGSNETSNLESDAAGGSLETEIDKSDDGAESANMLSDSKMSMTESLVAKDDEVDIFAKGLSMQDINLIIMGKPSSSNESVEKSELKHEEVVEELWLDETNKLKVDKDEDFENIVKSLETAIVATEDYDDIDLNISNTSETKVYSPQTVSNLELEPSKSTEAMLNEEISTMSDLLDSVETLEVQAGNTMNIENSQLQFESGKPKSISDNIQIDNILLDTNISEGDTIISDVLMEPVEITGTFNNEIVFESLDNISKNSSDVGIIQTESTSEINQTESNIKSDMETIDYVDEIKDATDDSAPLNEDCVSDHFNKNELMSDSNEIIVTEFSVRDTTEFNIQDVIDDNIDSDDRTETNIAVENIREENIQAEQMAENIFENINPVENSSETRQIDEVIIDTNAEKPLEITKEMDVEFQNNESISDSMDISETVGLIPFEEIASNTPDEASEDMDISENIDITISEHVLEQNSSESRETPENTESASPENVMESNVDIPEDSGSFTKEDHVTESEPVENVESDSTENVESESTDQVESGSSENVESGSTEDVEVEPDQTRNINISDFIVKEDTVIESNVDTSEQDEPSSNENNEVEFDETRNIDISENVDSKDDLAAEHLNQVQIEHAEIPENIESKEDSTESNQSENIESVSEEDIVINDSQPENINNPESAATVLEAGFATEPETTEHSEPISAETESDGNNEISIEVECPTEDNAIESSQTVNIDIPENIENDPKEDVKETVESDIESVVKEDTIENVDSNLEDIVEADGSEKVDVSVEDENEDTQVENYYLPIKNTENKPIEESIDISDNVDATLSEDTVQKDSSVQDDVAIGNISENINSVLTENIIESDDKLVTPVTVKVIYEEKLDDNELLSDKIDDVKETVQETLIDTELPEPTDVKQCKYGDSSALTEAIESISTSVNTEEAIKVKRSSSDTVDDLSKDVEKIADVQVAETSELSEIKTTPSPPKKIKLVRPKLVTKQIICEKTDKAKIIEPVVEEIRREETHAEKQEEIEIKLEKELPKIEVKIDDDKVDSGNESSPQKPARKLKLTRNYAKPKFVEKKKTEETKSIKSELKNVSGIEDRTSEAIPGTEQVDKEETRDQSQPAQKSVEDDVVVTCDDKQKRSPTRRASVSAEDAKAPVGSEDSEDKATADVVSTVAMEEDHFTSESEVNTSILDEFIEIEKKSETEDVCSNKIEEAQTQLDNEVSFEQMEESAKVTSENDSEEADTNEDHLPAERNTVEEKQSEMEIEAPYTTSDRNISNISDETETDNADVDRNSANLDVLEEEGADQCEPAVSDNVLQVPAAFESDKAENDAVAEAPGSDNTRNVISDKGQDTDVKLQESHTEEETDASDVSETDVMAGAGIKDDADTGERVHRREDLQEKPETPTESTDKAVALNIEGKSDLTITKICQEDDSADETSKCIEEQMSYVSIEKVESVESDSKIKVIKSIEKEVITQPLTVQIDDDEETIHRHEEAIPKLVISRSHEQRSSPKITIKPIPKPADERPQKREESYPKVTIKPVLKQDPLKITITKQRSDECHSILKIYKPDDSGYSPEEHVPKFTIKPVQKSDEAHHSPKITIKPIKPHSPKVTVKPVLDPDRQSPEVAHSPKLTIKPVLNPEENYPRVTIKPILRPDDGQKPGQSSQRSSRLKPMSFDSASGITMEPIPMASSFSPKSELGSKAPSSKHTQSEEPLSPKLTIKPIMKTCEIVQSEDGTASPLRLTIKPIMKPEDTYQSPKITIKPIVKPDDGQPAADDADKPERIILKIQKTNLSSPKERAGTAGSKKEPELKIEAVAPDDKTEKLGKIKLKLLKEGGHAQIIGQSKGMDPSMTIKRTHALLESGITEKRTKLERTGTEILHTSDISINIVEPNSKPVPRTISDEVTIVKIDKPVTNIPLSKPHPLPAPDSKFKNMLLQIQNKVDVTCTPHPPHAHSAAGDGVRVIEVFDGTACQPTARTGALDDVIIIHDAPSSFQDVQFIKKGSADQSPSQQTPKRRGRPRKNPLEIKPEVKDEEQAELVRPKRTCRVNVTRIPFPVKERKPRGAGRARGAQRGRGTGRSPPKPPKEPKTTPRGKALKQSKALAKKVAEKLSQEIIIDQITIEESNDDQSIVEPDDKETMIEPDIQMSEPSLKTPEKDTESICKPPPPVVYEEETRMSAESNSRAQTPARQVVPPSSEGPEESQSSMQSTATTESNKNKKGRLEISDMDSAVTVVEQIAEYSWSGGGPYMLQEQIAQYLGVKSFKRKYPGLHRRPVEMQERDFIREKGLVSESMCDLGLTAVLSSEILDIMYSDFQEKYEEYRKYMRDKQTKEITNKQKAISLATIQEKNKLDFKERAMRSAANWNNTFNKARRETRRCCMDLQTLTVNYPKGRIHSKLPVRNPIGHYPVALVPGQYTDFYKTYTSSDLHYLPLNTVRYGPVLPNQQIYDVGQSDGSQSDSDSSSSSDSDSSDDSMSTVEDMLPCKSFPSASNSAPGTPKSKV